MKQRKEKLIERLRRRRAKKEKAKETVGIGNKTSKAQWWKNGRRGKDVLFIYLLINLFAF